MSAGNVDPIITAAQARLRVAADLIERGCDELRAVLAALEQHPDFKRTARVHDRRSARRQGRPLGPAITLAWWIHNGVHSALFDLPLDDVSMCLVDDVYHAERTMRRFIETEAAGLARFARKRKRVQPSGKQRPAIVQARGASTFREAVAHG